MLTYSLSGGCFFLAANKHMQRGENIFCSVLSERPLTRLGVESGGARCE